MSRELGVIVIARVQEAKSREQVPLRVHQCVSGDCGVYEGLRDARTAICGLLRIAHRRSVVVVKMSDLIMTFDAPTL